MTNDSKVLKRISVNIPDNTMRITMDINGAEIVYILKDTNHFAEEIFQVALVEYRKELEDQLNTLKNAKGLNVTANPPTNGDTI